MIEKIEKRELKVNTVPANNRKITYIYYSNMIFM